MWQHIEPDRLLKAAEGVVLGESETAHLAWCEFCQEMLVFFVAHRPLLEPSNPDVRAA